MQDVVKPMKALKEESYERLLVYARGGLDVDCISCEISFVEMPIKFLGFVVFTRRFMKFDCVRYIDTKDDILHAIQSAWMQNKKIRMGAQLPRSGQIIKGMGFVKDLRFADKSDWVNTDRHATMSYSVLCPAVPFQ